MLKSEALQKLQSESQRERLSGARTLSRIATKEDIDALRRALRTEAVPWIRSALELGLARAATAPARSDEGIDAGVDPASLESDEALAADVYSRAVEELTDRFVHEFRPLVGLARVHARREIRDFESSKTGALLRRMQTLLRGIDTLGKAAAAPKLTTVDLASVVHEAATSSADELRAEGMPVLAPRLDGPEPLLVETDPDLLTLALRNAIRNAMEASTGSEDPVVVTWDQSKVEYWVAVLDFGVGLPPDGMSLFTIGSTTKAEHFGIGLAIVERVASALGGTPTLESLPNGTTRFQLRIGQAGPR